MLLARAAAVVGMGSQARQILGELGVESSRIFDAPNAHDQESIASAASRVDVDAFRRKLEAEFACRSRIALVVGRLVPAKGIVFLLQSWERLPEKIRDEWTLLFIGSGPLASLLEETMADSSDGEIVQLPAVQPAELIPYYAASSLLIFPSLSDPWGLVVNEALACGLPVLCSRLAGCADDLIQPGRNGWLVDPTDPADLYRALVETLSRLDLEALRGAALETAERFRPEAMADGMRNAVSFALRSAGAPSRS
jgi:glycosyltransferase involved in cell wall biosynthesis